MDLEQAKARLAELVEQNSGADANKDVSENSARDAVIAEIRQVQALIERLENQEDLISYPGCWGIGDELKVTYKRIHSYGQDKELPKEPLKIKLAKGVDVTKLSLEDPVKLVDINSAMGKALFNKAQTKARFQTTVGFCEIEVERAYV